MFGDFGHEKTDPLDADFEESREPIIFRIQRLNFIMTQVLAAL
jgi:hypothetical protein